MLTGRSAGQTFSGILVARLGAVAEQSVVAILGGVDADAIHAGIIGARITVIANCSGSTGRDAAAIDADLTVGTLDGHVHAAGVRIGVLVCRIAAIVRAGIAVVAVRRLA